MLGLFTSLGSVVPSPEAREFGQERLHVADVEGLVNLLDLLRVFTGFGVFYQVSFFSNAESLKAETYRISFVDQTA